MQDRPDSGELIDAVTRFIEQELLPTISDPRLRFRALIAANVLAVVSRELAQGAHTFARVSSMMHSFTVQYWRTRKPP